MEMSPMQPAHLWGPVPSRSSVCVCVCVCENIWGVLGMGQPCQKPCCLLLLVPLSLAPCRCSFLSVGKWIIWAVVFTQ
jgi:hypothetical protein